MRKLLIFPTAIAMLIQLNNVQQNRSESPVLTNNSTKEELQNGYQLRGQLASPEKKITGSESQRPYSGRN